ncbi:cellulase family glycosylhydrolase [Acidovorax sp. Root275]|uniref:glycoside hydrolase family 5 protein n=1 Tax=Acidovorax sp. Root275 TaxID=1736508 RepID=UPI000A9ECDB7|nr:cellulase family glycosylhydrolase [Acidovorax sp. Root275]
MVLIPSSWARWGFLLAMLWCGVGHAQAPLPSGPPPYPLGTQSGASRQAWVAAAALSRGIRLDAALETSTSLSESSSTAETIARAGFRTVRLTVPQSSLHSAWMVELGQESRLALLDETIEALLARGLHVVLGVRDGGTEHAGSPQMREESLPAAQARHRQSVLIWQHLARRYASRPQRLLFEVSFAQGAASTLKNRQATSLLKAIRKSNPTRVLVLGWADAIGLPQLELPGDRHLIVGITHVEPFRFTRQGVSGISGAEQWRGTTCCSAQELQLMALPLDIAKTWSLENRYPVWVRDFVSYQDIPIELRARHARLVRQAAEERGFSWVYGDFSTDFGIYETASHVWQMPLLQALLGP